MKPQVYLQAATFFGAALLAGCGGGGGDSAAASDPAVTKAVALTPQAAAYASLDALNLSFDSSLSLYLGFGTGAIPSPSPSAISASSTSSASYQYAGSISLRDLLGYARQPTFDFAKQGITAATSSAQATVDCQFSGNVTIKVTEKVTETDTDVSQTLIFNDCEQDEGEIQSGTIARKYKNNYFQANFSNYTRNRPGNSERLIINGDLSLSDDAGFSISSKHLVMTHQDTGGVTPVSDITELLNYSYAESSLPQIVDEDPAGVKIASSGRVIRKNPDFSYDISFANNPAAEGSRQPYSLLDEDYYPSAGILLIKDNKKSSQKIVVEVNGDTVIFTFTVEGTSDSISFTWGEIFDSP